MQLGVLAAGVSFDRFPLSHSASSPYFGDNRHQPGVRFFSPHDKKLTAVMADEGSNRLFQIARLEVIFEEQSVFEGFMPPFNLTLSFGGGHDSWLCHPVILLKCSPLLLRPVGYFPGFNFRATRLPPWRLSSDIDALYPAARTCFAVVSMPAFRERLTRDHCGKFLGGDGVVSVEAWRRNQIMASVIKFWLRRRAIVICIQIVTVFHHL